MQNEFRNEVVEFGVWIKVFIEHYTKFKRTFETVGMELRRMHGYENQIKKMKEINAQIYQQERTFSLAGPAYVGLLFNQRIPTGFLKSKPLRTLMMEYYASINYMNKVLDEMIFIQFD